MTKANTIAKLNDLINLLEKVGLYDDNLQAKYAKKIGKEEKVYLHAEILAILRAGKRICKAYSIEVCRYDKSGNTKLAKPCPICMEFIKTTPIKKIFYTE